MTTLKMHSPNLVDDNIAKIATLFPNCITEKTKTDEQGNPLKDKDGNIILETAIDFDQLKQELSHHLIDGNQERYRLDWVGKREAILTANSPIAKTLRPYRDESVDFDNTGNLFIEGDNLEALKLLQESYLGAVKMIYIDPPYNTGNDFIYNDDFSEDTESFFARSGQVDDNGNRLIANTESNGRFHSDWLSMMYSRLKLARNLLSDDGVIFISIDDNEVHNLRKICDEIFGAGNFIAELAVEISKTQGMKVKAAKEGRIVKNHEYILLYSKDIDQANWNRTPLYDKTGSWDNHFNCVITENNNIIEKQDITDFVLKDNRVIYDLFEKYDLMKSNKLTPKNIGIGIELNEQIKDYFYNQISHLVYQEMACSINIPHYVVKTLKQENIIRYDKYLLTMSANGVIRQYRNLKENLQQNDEYISEYSRVTIRGALWKGFYSDMMNVAKEGSVEYKNGKKPIRLIKQLIKWLNRDNALILDFFAGSATTAHAVMQLNAEDGGNRQFIMVQIPEKTEEKSEAFKAGFKTISEISKERIRRAGAKIQADNANKAGIADLDIGFRVLKIDTSNMADIYYRPEDYRQDLLDGLVDTVKADRSDEDLLFQFMLDTGVPLSLPIACVKIQGRTVYQVGGNSLVASLDYIDAQMIDDIARLAPIKFVTSEQAIASDSDKTNIIERFKQLSPHTDVRFI